MAITPQQFEVLLPKAATWVGHLEAQVLSQGEPLNDQEVSYARKIGVIFPEKIRLLKVEAMPQPTDPTLAWAAEQTGLLGPNIAGLTFQYAIFIRSDYWRRLGLVVHEMAHTHQYERLGGIFPFLRQYISECLTEGYDKSPLELEARMIERSLMGTNL